MVHTGDPSGWTVPDAEAIETAKQLRRKAYVNDRVTFLRSADTEKGAAPA
jgi:hypothetical protein